ncbi:MFS transporter [Marinitenerispora sediminis]|nr:MFS transporter [Marinitenerispora sediminis]RCV49584.1 MFS transporter [Marinitenerispora sediminis]RCV53148.1 MFS transporter [Marinitenerispora sediminis]
MRRARAAVWAYFFLAGMITATWASRIPAVKSQAGLDDGALSVALLGLAVGALAAMQVAGRLSDRFGSGAVMPVAAVLGCLSLAGPGHAASLPALFAALFAVGAGHGLIDVPMNVHAARVERGYGRPVMAGFHAAFSIGGFAGAGAGALAARAGLGAAATFWITALALLVLALAARGPLLPGRDHAEAPAASAPPRGRRPRSPRPSPRIVCYGLAALCAFLAEGSALDWSSVYLHDDLGASPALAAAAFSVFSAMMAAGRLAGDRLSARFGPVAVVRTGGLLAAAGLGAGLLVPTPPVALAGFAVLGLGLSCIVPQVFTATVRHDPGRAGRNLGFVAGVAYVGLLSGPVVIGAIAHLAGLAVGLAVPAVLALAVGAGATVLRPAGERGGPGEAPRRPPAPTP